VHRHQFSALHGEKIELGRNIAAGAAAAYPKASAAIH
jgi:hypothetical protein